MLKITHCNREAVVFEWDFECCPSGWCSLQFITVANYLCCKSTLLHRKMGGKGREQTCRTVKQLHESWHMSRAMKAPYVWIVWCRLIIRHVSLPEGHEDGLWKWSASFQISFIQATTKICHPLIIHSWVSHLKMITIGHNWFILCFLPRMNTIKDNPYLMCIFANTARTIFNIMWWSLNVWHSTFMLFIVNVSIKRLSQNGRVALVLV